MQENEEKLKNMHMGRLVFMLSHQLKREQKPDDGMED